jgi:hypothetical protein
MISSRREGPALGVRSAEQLAAEQGRMRSRTQRHALKSAWFVLKNSI